MKTVDYLDAIKASKNLNSDNELAKLLGLTRSSVSGLRYGKSFMCDETAITVAELLHIDPAPILLQAHAERSRDEKIRAVWSKIAAAMSAGGFVLTSGQNNSPADAPPRAAVPLSANSEGQSVFIMSTNVLRRFMRFLSVVPFRAVYA